MSVQESGPSPAERPGAAALSPHTALADIREKRCWHASGWLALGVLLVAWVLMGIWVLSSLAPDPGVPNSGGLSPIQALFLLALVGLTVVTLACLVVIQPGVGYVVQFFGHYVGSVRRTGLVLLPPLTTRSRVSLKVHNFESRQLKVNDANGNPVELAAIVVWQIDDTARALFAVEDYLQFVAVQSEAAVRHVAVAHPYDDPTGSATSLSGSTELVAAELAQEVDVRIATAGVRVLEVRISHLAYAPEIAQAMLQRQQASAIISARSQIVEGAVGMVEQALQRLEARSIVALDDERKAAMVSNLLVVLCSDSRATPVVNAGTLYS